MLTPDHIALVRQSYHLLDQVKGQAAGMFYGRLFSIAPDVRPLFASTDMFKQSEKLWTMLGSIVDMLDKPEKLMPAAVGLAHSHAGYGVRSEHYGPVGEALLWTVEQGMGASMSEETKQAWIAAYTALAAAMIEATTSAAGAPEVERPQ